MLELTIDNDVLIKLSRYGLLSEVRHVSCPPGCDGKVGVLEAARYVCSSRLARAVKKGDAAPDSIETFTLFIGTVEGLEPTPEELAIAARLEDAAQVENVPLDAGESILAAIALARNVTVLTGDKRAIVAMENLLASVPELGQVAGKVVCLEQALVSLINELGAMEVRIRVCADPSADLAIRLVFECGRVIASSFYPTGLTSYIDHLRGEAPTMLCDGYELRLAS